MQNKLLATLLTTTFLSTSAIALTLEPTLDDSIISYSEGISTDYNFTIQETDSDGNLTTKYYKMDIDENKLSTSSNISWTKLDSKPDDMTNVVELKLPNNQSKYFQYTYTAPSEWDTITESEDISVVDPTDSETHKYVGAAINNASGNDYGDIDKKVFLNNKVTANIENTTSDARKLYVYGGAIFNLGKIGDVTADFIGNSIETSKSGSYAYAISLGGAFYNSGTIGNISGDFIGNYASGTYAYGGAILNYAYSSDLTATIGNITGDFIGNYTKGSYAYGGAISNYTDSSTATIANITGNFIGNSANSHGGAIYNKATNSSTATINNIIGDFIGNNAGYGGAIYNYYGSIDNITGDFIGNDAGTYGGAIYNYYSSIDDITGDFISNDAGTYGGAIYNYYGSIGNITGDFIGNNASYGGAIYNYAYNSNSTATIGNITGDFIGNNASYGGAIYNYAYYSKSKAKIGDIIGDFIGNYTKSTSSNAYGSTISNYATNSATTTIGKITGDFIGNYAKSTSSNAYGGAIYNYADASSTASISSISGDFIGNYASGISYANGGVIYNYYGSIGDITGDFIDNDATATSSSSFANGGAIYNERATIGDIKGSFIDNSVISASGRAYGSAIYNYYATIGNVTGNFLNNNSSFGGTIYNIVGNIEDIAGDFTGNYATTGGGIYNISDSVIGDITGDFTNNYASSSTGTAFGGAVYNCYDSTIGDIIGNFIGNYAASTSSTASGGAISNKTSSTIGDVIGSFTNNYVTSTSGAVYGGAIHNDNAIIGNITGDFIGNYANSTSDVAYGGAIYSSSDITLLAKANDSSVIKDNYVEDINGKRGEAIYIDNSNATLTLKANNNGTIEVYDIINGVNGYDVKLTGDGTGSVSLFNDITNADIIAENVEVNLSNGEVKDYTFKTLTSDDTTNWNIDVDMVNATADNITSSDSTGTINLGKINNIGSTDETIIVQILKNSDDKDALQLALGDNFKIFNENLEIENTISYSNNYIREWGVTLVTTDTTNDSIRIERGAFFDTLVLVNDKETNEERSFIFDEAGTHTLNEDLLPTTAGTLNIVGFNNDAKSSIIDANGHSLFDLSNATTLNIEGVTLSNASGDAITVSDQAELNLTNVLFENNGGNAITSHGNVNINAKDTDIAMSENIAMNNAILSLNVENGALNLSNEISGSDYNLHLKGGNVNVSGSISGVNNLEMSPNAILGLGTSGRISTSNMMHAQDTSSLVSLKSSSTPTLQIDVDIADNRMTNGIIEVSGDVSGAYGVIVNALSTEYYDGSSVFLTALQDDATTSSDFSVLRVKGSPYMWKTVLNANGETTGSTWYLAMEKMVEPENNDTPVQPLGPIEVAPEIIGFEALQNTALAQTNGMVYNIMRKVGVNRLFCPGCGFYDYNWDGKPLHNAWVDTTYNGLTIEAPVEIDANVWGIEAGADIQHDLNNKLGIFVSYRQGNYEMDGKGEKYYSTIGSEIDIDSYLAGLYYRYEHNNWYAFATVYGGMQEAEIKTDDGVSADTDGIEFGGSIEGGYNYALTRTLSVTPSLGVFYSQINYDDATDSAGKTVEYNDLKQVELEVGAKFAHTQYTDDGFYSLYVKPSVVQTLVDGDEIDVTELGKVDTIDDKTLGRVEIGGNYGFNDNWSAYGWANYTFGSDYEATSLGLGVNYSW